jgi:GNAT superfamily N-acetyltransferase
MTFVRDAQPSDFGRWRELYRGYAEFYGSQQTDDMAERVWGWICDPGHEVQALVAQDDDGNLVGIAHYRPFARPLAASTGCYLDDLFVAPTARGKGVADALLANLRDRADARGWSVIRWITAADNATAQRVYDRVAERTMWVTYDMAPEGATAD